MRQPGVLVPSDEDQWGRLGAVDWEPTTSRLGKTPFVWSHAERARLVLPASSQRERMLEIELWIAPPHENEEPTQESQIRLNDVTVGTAQLGPDASVVRIETPAAVWLAGDNVLEIEIERLRLKPVAGEVKVGVAVARVAYDDPAEPSWTEKGGGLELVAGTGARYRLEEVGPLDLFVGGLAQGNGVLELAFSRIDPATGDHLADAMTVRMPLNDVRIERRLPVPDAQGDLLELSLAWDGDAGSLVRLGALRVIERQPRQAFPIVLLAIDTLSADRMGVYGYERDTTPRIDEFARDAVVFDHCVSNATWTLPSFMAAMTGIYAESHQVFGEAPTRQMWERWYLTDNRWTLAEALRAGGYRTGGFVDNLWLTEKFHFPQGFDVYDVSAGLSDRMDPDGGIRMVGKLALRHLEMGTAGRPDFVFLHCFDVHGPYHPEAPWLGMFHPEDSAQPDPYDLRAAGGVTNAFRVVPEYITAAEFREAPPSVAASLVTARYDEGVRMTDAGVGEFLDELRRRGVYDDALIVIFSDHGETAGDGHYLYGHGVLDEAVVHVPFLVKLPRNESAGLRVSETVQLVDLYPTIAELAGLPSRKGVHGRSLAGVLRGAALPPAPTLTIGGVMNQYSVQMMGWKLNLRIPGRGSSHATLLSCPDVPRSFLEEHFPDALDRPMTDALLAELQSLPGHDERMRKLRRLMSEPIYELYDLTEDPGEERDRRHDEPAIFKAMHALMAAELARQHEGRERAQRPATPAEISAEDAAELKKLGYVDQDL